jgi:hypothetical protein
MLLLALAAIGLVVLTAELFALRFAWRVCKQNAPDRQKRIMFCVLLFGALVAVGTFVWPFVLSYPYQTESGSGRIVGVPFFAAFFDAQGVDFVGPLTLPAAVANAVVWGLLPLTLLSLRWRL